MMIKKIKTQDQWDKLDKSKDLEILIQSPKGKGLIIKEIPDNWDVSIDHNCEVREMRGSSTVREMRGSSTVGEMMDSSTVREMRESSTVRVMRESSTVRVMMDSSTVGEMRESSTVRVMRGYASILLFASTTLIKSFGQNTIRCFEGFTANIESSMKTNIVILEKLKPTFDSYSEFYPVVREGKKVKMYKCVKAINGKLIANHDGAFEYKVGKIAKQEVQYDEDSACGPGLHVSHKQWAIDFGSGRGEEQTLLECLVDPKDIYVSTDCDGKVRCSKLKVLRIVPKEERYI